MLGASRGDAITSALGTSGRPTTERVPIGSLVASDSPRTAGESPEHAELLAEVQSRLPPIVVHRPTMRIIDGMHRVQAARLRGEDSIEVRYVGGSVEDAFVLAVQLNSEHGMPLSRQDRVAAAERIIRSHVHWSDRRIAGATGLSPATVGALRRRSTGRVDQVGVRTGRDGRSRPVNSAAGRHRAVQVIAERPNASLREIAQEAGIAPATARDVRQRIRDGRDPVPPKLYSAPQCGGASSEHELPARVPVQAADRGVRPRSEPTAIPGGGQLVNLRKDPSLRFSEAGRALLHLLAASTLDDERRRWLMAAVPPHRYADIARVARECGERWLSFADGLERGNGARRSAS
ncbi:ParB N-terminal domain-containing protein [Kitasatospora sp. NPDC093550]|uniref:ParB N-terminal domain-containing protein n=1 Tax=Kitasatospora sp. NPDC093550 TaxID=3364089 RepID=UPI00380CDD9B